MYKVIYQLVGKPTSESFKKDICIHGEKSRPPSQVWVCSKCGNLWCKVVVLTNDTNGRYITPNALCYFCGKGDLLLYKTRLTLPGSILMEGYNTIDELSEEMLRRELLLELRAMKLLINQGVL